MKAIGTIAIAILVVASLCGLGWVFTANDVAINRYAAPKYEQTRYETYKESAAHNEGTILDLRKYQAEYVQADADAKPAIASVILHQADAFGEDRLPADLQQFVHSLRNR